MVRNKLVRKGMAVLMTAVTVLALGGTFTVYALEDESTYHSSVQGTGVTYYRTIATNYHAGSLPGMVSKSSAEDMEKAVGITPEQKERGFEPVLYIEDFDLGSDEWKLADRLAQDLKGGLAAMVDVQLFRYEGDYFAPVQKTNIPVTMVLEIPEKSHTDRGEFTVLADYREYAVVRIHDGEVTLLKDLDDDYYTVTFETDQFSAFGLVYLPPGATEEYLKNQASAQTDKKSAPSQNNAAAAPAASAPSQNNAATAPAASAQAQDSSELDEVPKTGDILWELEYGYYR